MELDNQAQSRPCAQDYESLKEHLQGEAVKEFIKYTAKENVRLPTPWNIIRDISAISLHASYINSKILLCLTVCV